MTNSQLLSPKAENNGIIAEKLLSLNSSSPSPLHGLSFTSNLTARVAQAMQRHTSVTFKWLKQIEKINKQRDENSDATLSYHKKKL